MSQVIVDNPLAQILTKTPEFTELVDANGRILGFFTPCTTTLRELYDRAWENFDQCDFDEALSAGGGRPLSDILHDLRKTS